MCFPKIFLTCCFVAAATLFARADVSVPSLFGNHMVLQREQANPVWGKADPGEAITVTIADQRHTTKTDDDGKWRVVLDALPAGGPHELVIAGDNMLRFSDVLVGEVWVCSGQSNMQWPVVLADHQKLEIASANYPQIRLITVPDHLGSQRPQADFEGKWERCTPQSVTWFSAVGYFFGKRLHNTLGVPVGLINNAWGSSTAEAWLPRDVLEQDERYAELLASWDARMEAYTDEMREQEVAEHEQRVAAWEAGGKKGNKPYLSRDPRVGPRRPANLYNSSLHPILGYGIRGVIWYQGESNAERAYQYRELFPLMVRTWREQWGQGDFPFYWAQLADHRAENLQPEASTWAELREAQTLSLDVLPNSAQAVIIDTGEGRDIHPRNKQTVANRLASIALARDYGYAVPYQSPQFSEMTVSNGKATVTFEHVSDEGLYTFDVDKPEGFAIAGADRVFVWAEARLVGKDQVEVWSEQVPEPVAVRYGWADNPVLNLYDRNGLPVAPFRTDDWPGLTLNNVK